MRDTAPRIVEAVGRSNMGGMEQVRSTEYGVLYGSIVRRTGLSLRRMEDLWAKSNTIL